ncbi:MAG TPA: hypothetical protein VF183_07475 [Acidimicrobiales bacterium]
MGFRQRQATAPPQGHPNRAAQARRVLVRSADTDDGCTRLHLRDGRLVRIGALPDLAGADRVRGALRRVLEVDLTVGPDRAGAVVVGLGHRREHTMPVSVGTALGLVVQGTRGVLDIVEPQGAQP